jgi:ACS family sodium-dependent inorganic phosphate cotransporter
VPVWVFRRQRSSFRWPVHYPVVLMLCAAVFISYIDRTSISVGAVAMQAQMGWNETQKGLVLSSFFIGYLVMMLGAASLANRHGGRIVLGGAVIWWSMFTILTPPAALASLPVLIGARIALGLGEAAVFPASFNVIGQWVPVLHRSRAVALLASSPYLGNMFALPVAGWLAQRFGWPVPFYLFGAIGLGWTCVWFGNASRGADHRTNPAMPTVIPWTELLRSPAVRAIIVGHFCSNWSMYMLLAWAPSYFKHTFGVNLASGGVLSAAPWLAAFAMANIAGYAADRLLSAERSATAVRKLMQTIGLGCGAIFLLQLPNAASISTALVLLCCSTGVGAIAIVGFAPNCFDIAPRHADVVYGISNTFATLPGIFGVFATGWLVDRTGSFTAPFVLAAGISLIGALVYLAFGSGEPQIE